MLFSWAVGLYYWAVMEWQKFQIKHTHYLQKARPEHIPGGEPGQSIPVGTVLHPESGSHSFHPRTGNAEAALSETDIPGNLFSPDQNSPKGGRLPEPLPLSVLPGDSGSPEQWLPLSKDSNCHWRSCFLPASAVRFRTHRIFHCTAGRSAWYTARNRTRSTLSGNTHGEFLWRNIHDRFL